ncbi:hypothetical protein LPH50_02625 [Xylella taiwanensis]|uniref:Uncharacterized protein n=1 Tax=Xylella taiwanensis TaxID=1444770 RepID=Z9JMA4_9GAMM|nr:hypothetical protein [Xylella taiwanensis]EWS79098.1 hypothetical protein AF72_02695 [Xylella taiwanensis]MCD8457135.1 hypothetical protein [Xylella taiwanensis]MCD8459543.1 hypothetical protein [Xylella taiwanensis]MCD8461589.1 hypothetical protein [Xylella taiwanensis]MCD8462385.1 hypothetical protein [Xylella taiwanensis]
MPFALVVVCVAARVAQAAITTVLAATVARLVAARLPQGRERPTPNEVGKPAN